MNLAALILLSTFSWASAENVDSCLNRCSLEADGPAKKKVVCRCDSRDVITPLWENRGQKKFDEKAARHSLRGKLPSIPAADFEAIAQNRCQEKAKTSLASKKAPEILALLQLSKLSLCECVQLRTRFPAKKSCAFTTAGENLCRFELTEGKNSLGRPLRSPTLHDYQSCLAKRANYEPPASCNEACSAKPLTCGAGEELFNVADPEACCPTYTCRPKGEIHE